MSVKYLLRYFFRRTGRKLAMTGRDVILFIRKAKSYRYTGFRKRIDSTNSAYASQNQYSRVSGNETTEDAEAPVRSNAFDQNTSLADGVPGCVSGSSTSRNLARLRWRKAFNAALRVKRLTGPLREAISYEEISSLRPRLEHLNMTYHRPNSDHIRCLQFSSDGKFLATSR